jgi:putative tricarboxylic transport membrane protein
LLVANIAMLLIGLVILTPCLWLVNRPKPYLMAFVLALVMSGVYAIEGSFFDVALVLAAGVLGYLMRWFGMPALPMVLGVVLGFLVESNYRRSLVLSGGDHMIFVEDPVGLVLLICAFAMIAVSLVREFRAARTPAPQA